MLTLLHSDIQILFLISDVNISYFILIFNFDIRYLMLISIMDFDFVTCNVEL